MKPVENMKTPLLIIAALVAISLSSMVSAQSSNGSLPLPPGEGSGRSTSTVTNPSTSSQNLTPGYDKLPAPPSTSTPGYQTVPNQYDKLPAPQLTPGYEKIPGIQQTQPSTGYGPGPALLDQGARQPTTPGSSNGPLPNLPSSSPGYEKLPTPPTSHYDKMPDLTTKPSSSVITVPRPGVNPGPPPPDPNRMNSPTSTRTAPGSSTGTAAAPGNPATKSSPSKPDAVGPQHQTKGTTTVTSTSSGPVKTNSQSNSTQTKSNSTAQKATGTSPSSTSRGTQQGAVRNGNAPPNKPLPAKPTGGGRR